MSEAERRVARGGAWLDAVEPGWRSLIDPDLIDLTSPSDCIGGQVFAGRGSCCGYCHLCDLMPSRTTREQFGFEANEEADHGELRLAWVAAVNGVPK